MGNSEGPHCAMLRQKTNTGLRAADILVIAIWGWSGPSYAGAKTVLPIPRASSATEQKILEETLYLKEEPVSIASRYEQPISRARPMFM